jgi:8-oxo-dGTP diphosphatase
MYKRGPLAGKAYWATPGGAVEDGETFVEAACRELFEETGITRTDVGQQVAERRFTLPLPDGEQVLADERYFVVRVLDCQLSHEGWTTFEKETVADHRWWSLPDLLSTAETVFPEDLSTILTTSGIV